MIDTAMIWFKILHYDDKRAIMFENLVENTWLIRHPCPT